MGDYHYFIKINLVSVEFLMLPNPAYSLGNYELFMRGSVQSIRQYAIHLRKSASILLFSILFKRKALIRKSQIHCSIPSNNTQQLYRVQNFPFLSSLLFVSKNCYLFKFRKF